MTMSDKTVRLVSSGSLGIATSEGIAIEEARTALAKVTPPGAWALVEARVIREQRRGATPLMALQRVHGWIVSGWWAP